MIGNIDKNIEKPAYGLTIQYAGFFLVFFYVLAKQSSKKSIQKFVHIAQTKGEIVIKLTKA